MTNSLVVTSVGPPTESMKSLARGAVDQGVVFLCLGDAKSPAVYDLPGCKFVNLEEQQNGDFELARKLPTGHYSRKNIGYLMAMQQGAREILETDDDNSPLDNFWHRHEVMVSGRYALKDGWVNAYSHFSDDDIWPRGFPLEEIVNPGGELENITDNSEHWCPVQQGLANGDADVDAIYRLTCAQPTTFRHSAPLILGNGTWCPFNSQNTWWAHEVFELMYLPSYCSFRMTDIWRSFIAQACMWPNQWYVAFQEASVFQNRNQHNLMRDFENEIVGYLNNRRIGEELASLELLAGKDCIYNNMILCYQRLIDMGLIADKELLLLDAWLRDLATIFDEN